MLFICCILGIWLNIYVSNNKRVLPEIEWSAYQVVLNWCKVGHKYSLEKAVIFLYEGIIIENVIKEGVTLDVQDVRRFKEVNLTIAANKNYALLIDAKAESTITDEARKLLASKELAHLTIAKAIIIHTQKQKILGNIYLTVNKPHVKTRLFTERSKAIAWLQSKIEHHSVKEILDGGNKKT